MKNEDSAEAEVVDVTEKWMKSMRCIDNVQFDFQEPSCIHPESDIKSRPSISSREQLRAMYPECFTGIGTFKNHKYHIELNKNAKPLVYPVRKIALALFPKLDKELHGTLADGIIVPVEEPMHWVNLLVVREKPNGSLRVCLDPRELNKTINREHYSLPTVDSVTAKLHSSTLFSRLDANSAYWNVAYLPHSIPTEAGSDTRECLMV